MGKIADFFVELTTKADTTALKLFSTTLSTLTLGTVGEIASLAALGIAFKDVGEMAMNTGSHLTYLNEVFGLNKQNLQQWEYAAAKLNVTAQQTEASFAGIAKNLGALSIGQGSQGFMQALGFLGLKVNPNAADPTADIMNQLLVKVPQFLKNRGEMGRLALGQILPMLGVDPSMIQFLERGGHPFVGPKLPTVSDKEIAAMTQLSEKLSVLKTTLEVDLMKAFDTLIPILTTIADTLTTYLSFLGGAKSSTSLIPTYGSKMRPTIPGTDFVIGEDIGEYLSKKFGKNSISTVNVTNNNTIHATGASAETLHKKLKQENAKHQRHVTQTTNLFSGAVLK